MLRVTSSSRDQEARNVNNDGCARHAGVDKVMYSSCLVTFRANMFEHYCTHSDIYVHTVSIFSAQDSLSTLVSRHY